MQTRAASKRFAELALKASNSVDDTSNGQTEVTQASGPSSAPDSSETKPTSTGKTISGGTKRKRGGKKQAQPLKGGWVLPHGMGVGLAEPARSDLPAAESTVLASSLAGSPNGVVNPTENDAPGAPRPNTEPSTTRQTRQTRLTLRVTKIGTAHQKSSQNKQEPTVKLEDSEEPSIKQEDGRPSKRVRTAMKTTGAVTTEQVLANTPSSQAALELSNVKVEEKLILKPPKLLIIKGLTIKDNIITKVSAKITIDATQILDPNYRIMVKRGKDNPYGLTPGYSPYPYRRVPTPEACEEVHRILTEMHGEVKQPEKMPAASLEIAGCGEVPCVLDALLRTLISGNTTMALADAAIKNLAQHYGLRKEGTGAGSIDWDKVRLSTHQELIQTIKVAGNGPKRSQHIKQILDMVYAENVERAKTQASITAAGSSQEAAEPGKATQNLLSLDHMHGMTKDEAMAKFVSYPGIGIKTAACVTLFCLRLPCFAVDTHVHKFCRWLGWVPEKADPDNCFRHGDFMVPDHLKYGLHQLFIRHGQTCFKCRKATKPGTKDWNEAPDCPLEHLLDRSKDEAGSKAKPPRKVKEETSSGTDESESELSSGDEEDEEK